MKYIYKLTVITVLFLVTSCIENDIPYPTIFGEFLHFSVEGQIGTSLISQEDQTVIVRVPTGYDLTNLTVDSIAITEGAVVAPNPLEVKDFSQKVVFKIDTYQEYYWEVFVETASEDVNITHFEIEGQISTDISEGSKAIRVTMPAGTDLSDLSVSTFEYLPSTATVSPNPSETHDFTAPVVFTFNDEINWTVTVIHDGDVIEGDQVPYSDFQTWFQEGTGNKSFYLPGQSLSENIWRSGDKGAADLTIKTYPQTVLPYPSMDAPEYAVLETKTAVGVIAAGSLFVGDIQGSGLADVKTDFGIPFTDRPISFTTEVDYTPKSYGDNLMDKCDIYVILQVREGSGENEKRYRLATGWFRSDENMSDFTTLDIPMLYGNHSSLESFMMPSTSNEEMPENGFYEDETANPTHIIIVFASSADGANFNGGIGSKLKVKGIELNY
ncbi:PCMD domain-containing protein [Flammeovirga pacifica]|uniref:Putative carbohydrate metabolism domain-containing protein n=1 Tax=Flammeovirga pacifica TaxID=915059 RepID=A0A1S1YU88_FLAPC|nr:PCMD domain-containing protein [Flammeovirga pacifica]OHX64597.1 hypothetical protein NH26_23790 [Flammeovirga pacifica]